ncbi:chromate reductase [Variovorax sp. PDC80]|uniref:NADPH-dependent FMN reductase n=1 Tax=Variovorax sp. PDC80 TaxID=1882827 RepID=UPI0008E3F321|nr:NAD(P)H-dependent oxidoreductase [Variovorax sp. PDC80]SFN99199.1 chromate reductase [Variovorax sp. PDC80]
MMIVGLCGSLRSKSYNMSALRACEKLMPAGMTLEIVGLDDIPMYNQDLFDAGLPPSVRVLRDRIKSADGVLIVTPEYNFSVPAVLKNAIDWCSRAPDQSFQDKPVAIFSAATGPLGGARVQYDLRRILLPLWGFVLPRPEVFIGCAAEKFDDAGNLIDATTAKFIAQLLASFELWIRRNQSS